MIVFKVFVFIVSISSISMIYPYTGYCNTLNNEKFNYKVRHTSYPFSCTNTKHNLFKRIRTLFKNKEKSEKVTNPPDWPGEGGEAVEIPGHLKEESERRFKENQFNIVASELIALNRSIPDNRAPL
jgi:hypothetical protein